MKPTPKEDQKKMYALVGGVVIVFGFVGFQLLTSMGILGGAPAPTAEAAPIVISSGGTPDVGTTPGGTVSAVATGLSPSGKVALMDPPAVAPATPFREISKRVVKATPPAGITKLPDAEPFPAPTGQLPPLPVTRPDENGASQPEAPKVDPPKLIGLIDGYHPIAIVLLNGTEWIGRKGSKGPLGWEMEAVNERSVILRRGTTTLTLKES